MPAWADALIIRAAATGSGITQDEFNRKRIIFPFIKAAEGNPLWVILGVLLHSFNIYAVVQAIAKLRRQKYLP
jgi:hypothetical protein